MAKKQHWALQLFKLGACNSAVRHCLKYKTPAQAWKAFSVKDGEAEGWVFWLTKELTGEPDNFLRARFEHVTGTYPYYTLGNIREHRRIDLRPFVPVPTLEDLRTRIRGDFPWLLFLEEP